MIELGTEVPALTDEHRDGTIFADIEGDLWTAAWPDGWMVTRRVPFCITPQRIADAGVEYGPYRAILGPPDAKPQEAR